MQGKTKWELAEFDYAAGMKYREIAEKYGASIPQVCVRFVYQLGALPLPKTTHKEFMISNAEIDFELSPEDMMALQRISFRRTPTK